MKWTIRARDPEARTCESKNILIKSYICKISISNYLGINLWTHFTLFPGQQEDKVLVHLCNISVQRHDCLRPTLLARNAALVLHIYAVVGNALDPRKFPLDACKYFDAHECDWVACESHLAELVGRRSVVPLWSISGGHCGWNVKSNCVSVRVVWNLGYVADHDFHLSAWCEETDFKLSKKQ